MLKCCKFVGQICKMLKAQRKVVGHGIAQERDNENAEKVELEEL